MKVFIKPKAGAMVTVEVEPTEPIADVKAKIRAAMDFAAEKCFLLFSGTHLEDEKTLADYRIQDEFTLHIHEDRCGC
jgi:hypothetical protein